MHEIIKTITKECRSVVPESYYKINPQRTVTYPYLVFGGGLESISWDADNYNLEIDLFHNQGSSQSEIEKLATDLKKHLEHYTAMLDSCYIRVQYLRTNDIPTHSDTLQRRNMTFTIKIDWRN